MTFDTNYPEALAAIRDDMHRMKEAAIKYKSIKNECSKEFNRNGQSALFDILNERGKTLHWEYERIHAATTTQFGNYDREVGEKGLEHLQAWYDLTEEYRHYTSIDTLATAL